MEKIIITCNADYLSYEFPKRKWYQWLFCRRVALMQLEYGQGDILEADILLRIYENYGGFFETEENREKYMVHNEKAGFDY